MADPATDPSESQSPAATDRRRFLVEAGALAGGGWLALNAPALLAAGRQAAEQQAAQSAWVSLSEPEARIAAALVDRIMPPDDLPGAAELGVVYFIDQALAGFMAGAAEAFRAGLGDLERRAGPANSGSAGFAGLPPDAQDELLRTIEDTPFFTQSIFLTHAGLFAMPSWGGNRDRGGWSMLGFDSRHGWQPPFGYYDTQALAEQDHGEG